MRFWTIWSMPSYPLAERLRRTRDWSAMKVASNLPLRIRYWVTLLEIGKATMDSPNVPATKLEDILNKMETPHSLR